jgi:hypothetical protein
MVLPLQGGIAQALVSIVADDPAFQAFFGAINPPCQGDFGGPNDQVIYGNGFQACNTPGSYIWAQEDTNTANCLIDLHYLQDELCISVEGSSLRGYQGDE